MTVSVPSSPDLSRIRPITTAEYFKMAEVGILRPGERVELLDGVVCSMSPTGWNHRKAVLRLQSLILLKYGDRYLPFAQSTFELTEGQAPEPDLAVFRQTGEDRPPRPEECLLIVEVSDTSIRLDTTVKPRLYASAGIPEYWVVDIQNRRLLQMTEPIANEGRYARIVEHSEDSRVEAGRLPGFAVTLKELLELPQP